MTRPKRCGSCGSQDLSVSKAPLRIPWKDYPAVNLTSANFYWSCNVCSEILLNASQAKELDKEIHQLIHVQVLHFISSILQRENCEQKELALRLGVSPEYLSEIKSGRKTPSFQTFNFLKTLSIDAKAFAVSSPTFKIRKIASGD